MDADQDRQDRETLERVKGGDLNAYRAIVERYKNPLHQFVRAFLNRPGDAEDVAQEVFLQAYRSLHTFRGEAKFSTWLYSVARFVCLHEIRRRKDSKTETLDPLSERWAAIADPGESQQARLEREEAAQLVRSTVDSLSPALRPVVVLAFWEDMTYPEISDILQIPVGTVKSRMHNAVAAVLKALDPALGPEKEHSP